MANESNNNYNNNNNDANKIMDQNEQFIIFSSSPISFSFQR